MKKSLLPTSILITLLLLLPVVTQAESSLRDNETSIPNEVKEEMERLSDESDFSDWQAFFDDITASYGVGSEYDSVKSMVESIASGGTDISVSTAMDIALELLLPNLFSTLRQLTVILVLSVLVGLCSVIVPEGQAKETLMLFISCTAVLTVVGIFSDLVAEAADFIESSAGFCSAATPVLLGLLSTLGLSGTSKFLSPTLIFLADGIIAAIRSVVIPILLLSGVLSVLSVICEKLNFGKLFKQIQKSVKWGMGLLSAIYIAVTSVGGLCASTADSIGLRTAKYTLDKLIPAVGGMVSGTVDSVLAGGYLLKNAAGVTSLILLAGFAARPILKIAGGIIAVRLAAGISGMTGDDKIPKLLENSADALTGVFSACCAVLSMLFITLIIIINTGGAMFR